MKPSVAPLTSLALDLIRFGLALTVAIGHWTQHYFQEGWPDLTRPAVAAVGGFFVLSGYTIRLLSPAGAGFSGRAFFAERLSRLWSVALPALALTLVLDGVSFMANPGYYLESWGVDADHITFRMFINAVFASQVWGNDISPLSNSLFWSLGYEAGFYVLYGAYRSTAGTGRVLLVTALALAMGPNILLMFPLWLSGVLLHDLTQGPAAGGSQHAARRPGWGIAGAAALCVCIGAGVLLARASVDLTQGISAGIAAAFHGASTLMPFPVPGIQLVPARISGSLVVGALCFCAFLLLTLLLCARATQNMQNAVKGKLLRLSRALGDFTFPLYLFHFPIFVLLAATEMYDRNSAVQKTLLFCLVCTAIFLTRRPLNEFKKILRRALSGDLGRGPDHLYGKPGT